MTVSVHRVSQPESAHSMFKTVFRVVYQMLSGFLVKRLDNTYMFFHPSFREWLMRRDEGESTKFLCDLRLGHAAIAYRLSRLQAPLDGDKALELGHHILKAHVYRGVAPCWPSRDLQVKSTCSCNSRVHQSLSSCHALCTISKCL